MLTAFYKYKIINNIARVEINPGYIIASRTKITLFSVIND